MTAHDPACRVPAVLPPDNCLTCRAITTARSQERATYEKVWAENLPLITERARRDERASVEKRVRESGVARWLPPGAWETLVTAVRGSR